MLDLTDTAVSYAEQGWPVFPCRPGGKVPVTPHGCLDASNDVDRIRSWWARHPACNIGLRTGDVFDVLDLDGIEGCDAFDAWCITVGLTITFESVPAVSTPSGGFHLYWEPTGAGNRAKMLPGIDWRGHHGYVIAAGSTRPDGDYFWYADPPELSPAPQALIDLVTPAQIRPDRLMDAPRLRYSSDSGDGTRYGYAALSDETRRVAMSGQGHRNDQLNESAFVIYQLVAGGQLAEYMATEALTAAARTAGLDDREIAQTLRSARRSGTLLPRIPTPR